MGVADTRRKGPHEGLLVHRDSRRLVAESFGPDLQGRRCSPRREHQSPPLVIRPGPAKRPDMRWPPEAAGPSGEANPPPLEEMDGTVVLHHGKEVYTLCATSYDTSTAYQAGGRAGGQRVARPNNWRLERALREETERAQQEETRRALEALNRQMQGTAEPPPHEHPSASLSGNEDLPGVKSVAFSTSPRPSHGPAGTAPPGGKPEAPAGGPGSRASARPPCRVSGRQSGHSPAQVLSHDPSRVSVGSHGVPTGHPSAGQHRPQGDVGTLKATAGSLRRPWTAPLAPQGSPGTAPRCASAVPAHRRPMSALSRVPAQHLRPQSAGPRVYRRPESAGGHPASRRLAGVESVVARSISRPSLAPDPQAGLYGKFCGALLVMNRGMDPNVEPSRGTGPKRLPGSSPRQLSSQLSIADVVKDRVHVGADHRHSSS